MLLAAMNWRVETVIACLVVGAIVGVIGAILITRRVEPPQGVSRFNLGAAIFAGVVGFAGLVSAILANT